MKTIILFSLAFLITSFQTDNKGKYEKDGFMAKNGQLRIYFIGHGSLMFEFNGKIIDIDPSGMFANYDSLPKADLILITHHHSDHLDSAAISKTIKKSTEIILPQASFDKLKKGTVMKNGEKKMIMGIEIEAIPAYNVTAGREKYHPKGRDNGYVLTIGGRRIYVAGDTENTPEMEVLKNIDIAFLPMNQPYTMLPEQVADVANKFNPKILYPYHFDDSDTEHLKVLLSKNKKVEIRIRKMK